MTLTLPLSKEPLAEEELSLRAQGEDGEKYPLSTSQNPSGPADPKDTDGDKKKGGGGSDKGDDQGSSSTPQNPSGPADHDGDKKGGGDMGWGGSVASSLPFPLIEEWEGLERQISRL